MVDYCEEVLMAIRSAPDNSALERIVRDSVVKFMRTRSRHDSSRYVFNMIAYLHSAVRDAEQDKDTITQAIELFKQYQLRGPELFLPR